MHIYNKNMLKRIFYSNMPIYPFIDLMQRQASHIDQLHLLTKATSNTYPIIFENHDLLKLYHQGITSQE